MTHDPARFLQLYYEVVIFEYWGVFHSSTLIPFHKIARAFHAALDVYDDFPHLLSCPCDQFIVENRLYTGEGVYNFVKHLQLKVLPSCTVEGGERFYDSDMSDGPFFEPSSPRNIHFGYRVTPKGVVLPNQGYDSIGFRFKFADNYARNIPLEYQDDISVLILECRSRLKGYISPTVLYELNGLVHGISQYTRKNSEKKLREWTPDGEGTVQSRRVQQQERARANREQEIQRQQAERASLHAETRKIFSNVEDYITKLQKSTMVTELRKSEVEDLRQEVEGILNKCSAERDEGSFEVLLYGSHASGLSNTNSDVDLVVMSRSGNTLDFNDLVADVKWAGFHVKATLPNARTPIVTFYDRKTKLTADVCIDQPLGVENSKLINIYRQMDDRFMPLWVAVRLLAKRHNILDGRKHYLSSYALTLMLISYLQMCNILPKLQESKNKLESKKVWGWECAVDPDWQERKRGHDKEITVAVLLLRVCRYFGTLCDYGTMDFNARKGICDTRSVKYILDKKEQKTLLNAPICIMDPFVRKRNVACNISSQTVERIRDAFQKSYHGLLDGDLSAVFPK